MRLVIAFILLSFIDAGAAILEAKGMRSIGEISTLNPRELLGAAARAVKSIFIWLGFFLEIENFLLFMLVLNWADVSEVVPVMGAGSYLLSILGAKMLLREKVSRERLVGSLLIGAGILLVTL